MLPWHSCWSWLSIGRGIVRASRAECDWDEPRIPHWIHRVWSPAGAQCRSHCGLIAGSFLCGSACRITHAFLKAGAMWLSVMLQARNEGLCSLSGVLRHPGPLEAAEHTLFISSILS